MTTYSKNEIHELRTLQAFQKRTFDLFFATFGLLTLWWLILITWVCASFETRSNGFFIQKRVGLNGRMFSVIKIKTMRPIPNFETTVTKNGDPRITVLGAFFRKTKIDELPQLWNILVGDMSFVGPRPDVKGYADQLKGSERSILSIRPGITGPASLKYHDEAVLLAKQDDPESYNKNIIWPDKVRINMNYICNWSLKADICYIFKTIRCCFYQKRP